MFNRRPNFDFVDPRIEWGQYQGYEPYRLPPAKQLKQMLKVRRMFEEEDVREKKVKKHEEKKKGFWSGLTLFQQFMILNIASPLLIAFYAVTLTLAFKLVINTAKSI